MFISAFCKICELNTEREIVLVLISVDSQGDITQVQFQVHKRVYKPEAQTVILRCLLGLNSNFSRVVKQNANISISVFLLFCKKNSFAFFVFFCFVS